MMPDAVENTVPHPVHTAYPLPVGTPILNPLLRNQMLTNEIAIVTAVQKGSVKPSDMFIVVAQAASNTPPTTIIM